MAVNCSATSPKLKSPPPLPCLTPKKRGEKQKPACRISYYHVLFCAEKSLHYTTSFAPHLVPFGREIAPFLTRTVSLLFAAQHAILENHKSCGSGVPSPGSGIRLSVRTWAQSILALLPTVTSWLTQEPVWGLFSFTQTKELQPVEANSRRFFSPIAAFPGEPTKPWQCSSGARMVLCGFVFFLQRELWEISRCRISSSKGLSPCVALWWSLY